MIRVWGNKHGHGVVFTGKDAKLLQKLADLLDTTPQKAFNKAMKFAIKRWRAEKHVKAKV